MVTTINIDFSNIVQSGFTVSGGTTIGYFNGPAGDVNCDGIPDTIVGDGSLGEIIFGQRVGSNVDVSTMPTTIGIKISYSQPIIIYAAGDHNGDGCGDILATYEGAPGGNPEVTWLLLGNSTISNINLSTFTNALGYSITNSPTSIGRGIVPSSSGDVNKDNFGDFTLCFPYTDTVNGAQTGLCFTFLGKSTGFVNVNLGSWSGSLGSRTIGANINDNLARSLSYLDYNKDGYYDNVFGVPNALANGNAGAGKTIICFGKASPTDIDLKTASTSICLVISGTTQFAGCGSAVAGLGDTNGDGVDDLGIGCPNARSADGAAYDVFGKTGAPSNINLLTLTSSQGYNVTGRSGDQCRLGNAIWKTGSINGDIYNEWEAAANVYSSTYGNGHSYIFIGVPNPSNIALSNPDYRVIDISDNVAVTTNGPRVNGGFDINLDGFFDLSICDQNYGSGGMCFIMHGDNITFPIPSTAVSSSTGSSKSSSSGSQASSSASSASSSGSATGTTTSSGGNTGFSSSASMSDATSVFENSLEATLIAVIGTTMLFAGDFL